MSIGSIQHRHLIYSLVARDLRTQYMGSFFGVAWLVLRPLAWMAIYSFALSVVLGARTGSYETIPFPVWLLTGLLTFMFFSEAASTSVTSITGQRNLIKKTLFDKSVLPLVCVTGTFVNHLVGIGVLILVMICFGVSFLSPALLWLPIISAILFLYTLGWAYLLSSIQVFVRDTSQMVVVTLQLLFFLTPIIYPESRVPPWALTLMKINPHFFFVRFYRDIFLRGQGPNWWALVAVSVVCVLFFRFGKLVFNRLAPEFADVI